MLPVQLTHAPPEAPHCAGVLPATHIALELQQPPLHARPPEQLVLHWCRVVSHASPTGQSPVALQPHWLVMHAWPIELMPQSLGVEQPHAPLARHTG
jgi:hypothetical protein